MKWFKNVKSIEELRKRYRELLKKYNPDNDGGSVEITQQINAEYDAVFARMSHENNSDGQSYAQEENEQFKAILNKISGFNMTVEIIGSWLWCFDCFQYKEKLKELGFRWAAKKRAWVWHSEPYRRHHKGEIPLDKIKERYGCKTIRNHSRQCAID